VVAIQRDNPYPNHNFEVSIVGVTDENLGFSEVELPSGEIAVIEYREGRDASTVRKLPGLVAYPNVTLKRGINGYLDLYTWWKAARDGDVRRADVSIKLLDEQHREVMRWNLSRAWPVKLVAAPLNATANEVAIETLELAHEGFEIE
jgi:phage tail-like protein